MKEILLVLALAFAATTVFAEEVEKKPSVKGFVSNGFWDNWELSLGAGIGTSMNDGKNYGKLSKRVGWEGDLSAIKWVHPVFGARLQLQGGNLATYSTSDVRHKWSYVFVHTDLLVNFSNWVGGYREDRAYYGVPFFGFGYMAGNVTKKSQERNGFDMENYLAFSYGWLSKFRLSQAWELNLELKGLVVPSQVLCGVGNVSTVAGNYTFGFSANAGFTYRFNKRGWSRCESGYSYEEIRAYQEAVDAGAAALLAANAALLAASADNERLAKEVAALQNAAPVAPAVERSVVELPGIIILYDIADTALTDKERTRLEMLAIDIKAAPGHKKYSILGYADQETGTDEVNKALGEKRAKAAYDYLVSLGVNADQLTYEGRGNDDDMTSIIKGNRAVIIK